MLMYLQMHHSNNVGLNKKWISSNTRYSMRTFPKLSKEKEENDTFCLFFLSKSFFPCENDPNAPTRPKSDLTNLVGTS